MKPKPKEYIKVLRRHPTENDKYISCWINNIDWQITYEHNRLILPKQKGSKILIFDNIENAVRFGENLSGGLLFFHVKPLFPKQAQIMAPGKFNAPYFREFWSWMKQFKNPTEEQISELTKYYSFNSFTRPTKGTYFCTGLTLIKRIQ